MFGRCGTIAESSSVCLCLLAPILAVSKKCFFFFQRLLKKVFLLDVKGVEREGTDVLIFGLPFKMSTSRGTSSSEP